MRSSEKEKRIVAARRRDLLPSLVSVLVSITNAWQYAGRSLRGDPQPPIEATPAEQRFITAQWKKIHSWQVRTAQLFGGTASLAQKGSNFFHDVQIKAQYLVDVTAALTGDISYTRHLKILTAVYELLLYDYIVIRRDRRQPLLYLDRTLCTFCDRMLPCTHPDNLAVNKIYYTARARALEFPDFSVYAGAPKTEAMAWAETHADTELGRQYLELSADLDRQLPHL